MKSALTAKVAVSIIMLLVTICLVSPVQAQTATLTVVPVINGSNLDVSVYIARTGGTAWGLGFATLALNYNTSALTFSSLFATGIWNNPPSAQYGAMSTAVYGAAQSLEVDFSGVTATDIPTSATLVGTLRFTITNTSANHNITWDLGSSAVLDGPGNNVTAGIAFTDPTNTPLPVQLVSFSAKANRLTAQLSWSTATEKNNYGFDIERKLMGSDASQWTKVAFVAGSGTKSTATEYSYADKGVTPGRYAYRVKQLDNDGTYTYSMTAEVEVGAAEKVLSLSDSYPNPFNPSTLIEFTLPKDGRATLKVYNAIGQEVANLFDGEATAGRIIQGRFDAKTLATGLYFARLQFDGKMLMKKMLFVK